jgi:4-oxalocrotonate tautomerase
LFVCLFVSETGVLTMPTLRIDMMEGRTAQQKADLARELTDAVVRVLGGSPQSVDILMYDIPRHNWATGGVLWSEHPPANPAADSV